jgi:hypothetical protein
MLCISVIFPAYCWPMIFFPRKLAALFFIPLLTQCGPFKSAPPTQTVTGPFDSRGNYIEDWVDQPDKWYRPPAPGTGSKPKTAIATHTPPEPPVTTSTQAPVVVKPKPKPKPPAFVRHTVKRGDTLSGLARRYKSTVSKIQKANGLRNTVIRLGQTLKIPR